MKRSEFERYLRDTTGAHWTVAADLAEQAGAKFEPEKPPVLRIRLRLDLSSLVADEPAESCDRLLTRTEMLRVAAWWNHREAIRRAYLELAVIGAAPADSPLGRLESAIEKALRASVEESS